MSQQIRTVYSLANAITIQGTQNVLNPTSWTSDDFELEMGSSLYVTMNNCNCELWIWEDFPPFLSAGFSLNGKPSQANSTVPDSGPYYLVVQNLDSSPMTVRSLTMIEQSPESIAFGQTSYLTTRSVSFNTVKSTRLISFEVAPYSVLGVAPSAAVLLLICILVLFVALLDRGILSTRAMGETK